RGALVGASPAQPERAAAQGPAAVPARRDGDERAVAAHLLRPAGRPDGASRAGRGAPAAREDPGHRPGSREGRRRRERRRRGGLRQLSRRRPSGGSAGETPLATGARSKRSRTYPSMRSSPSAVTAVSGALSVSPAMGIEPIDAQAS